MNWETYIAFGDSITIGARTYLGYPELVGNTLQKQLKKPWNVVNYSVNGYKAIDLARQIDMNYSNLKEENASVSSILIGTNDIKEGVPLADYEVALNQIVLKVKLLTLNKNVVLFFLPPFENGVAYPYTVEMNKDIETYNTLISKVAEEHDIKTLKLELTGEHFIDGVHLNDPGNREVSKEVAKYILHERGLQLG